MRLDPAAFVLVMVPVIAQDPPDLFGGRRGDAPEQADLDSTGVGPMGARAMTRFSG